jgi:hypothetical protein
MAKLTPGQLGGIIFAIAVVIATSFTLAKIPTFDNNVI